MSLNSDERQVMVTLEMERADRLMANDVMLAKQAQLWDLLANRLYYAVFHAVSSLLIKHEIKVSSHKGAILMFNQKFVLPGHFTEMDRKLISQLEGLRENGDYNCFIDTTEEQIMPYIEKAQTLIQKIKTFMDEEDNASNQKS